MKSMSRGPKEKKKKMEKLFFGVIKDSRKEQNGTC